MLLTEEEAGYKCCPHKAIAVGPAGDVYMTIDDTQYCVGSKCMAWRWSVNTEYVQSADPQAETGIRHTVSDKGYCGLSGFPLEGQIESPADTKREPAEVVPIK